jgi:hypothetical protein
VAGFIERGCPIEAVCRSVTDRDAGTPLLLCIHPRNAKRLLKINLNLPSYLTIIIFVMAIPLTKVSGIQARAQKRAAQKAEEAAEVLHSFAATLNSLGALPHRHRKTAATPRNWWRTQAGRFRNDPTFAEFVAQVQAARKREG